MAVLRLILYGQDFTTLDSVDVPVTGTLYRGAGAATKTARDHFWSNHVKDDLDTILASRKTLIDATEAILQTIHAPPYGVVSDGAVQALKGALQEARMVDDLALPKTYVDNLGKKFGL